MKRQLGVFLILAIAAPGAASAQAIDTAMVPRELALALASESFFGRGAPPQILVGKPANPDAASLLPAGAHLLGGIIYSTPQVFAPVMTVFTFDERETTIEDRIDEHMLASGWEPPPREPIGSPFGSGMLGAAGGRGMHAYCRGEQAAMIVTSPSTAGGTLVRVSIGSMRNGVCDKALQESRFQRTYGRDESSDLPVLLPPPKASGGGTGYGSSGSGREYTARFESDMGADVLVAHYARQLEKAGWKPGKPAGSEDVALQLFRKADSTGAKVLVLTDVRIAPSHDVTLRVRPDQP